MDGYYRVPGVVREDIRALERQVELFKEGNLAPAKFRGFRVPLGIYEQREPGTYMMRVRIPGGGITPNQLRALARLAEEFGVKIHVTTRQDIQLQNVRLEDLAPLSWKFYQEGLTCKGGGGNTVRNITSCPDAGICSREAFDVLPHAIGLTEYMIQFPSSFNLPRKFKIGFSGCSDDCGLATVNDLGFIAKRSNGESGFSVYVAGGMGAHSRVAERLYDFVGAADIGYVAEAVKRLFDRYGDRKRKHQARLRFVLEKFGRQKFFAELEKELQGVKEEGPVGLEVRAIADDSQREAVLPTEEPADGAYRTWLDRRVEGQKQPGYHSVKLPVPLGDIEPKMLEAVAALADEARVTLRTTLSQDFLFRWIKEGELPALYNRLSKLGLAGSGPSNIDHLVCCKGAATCKLGLCLSQGLARALADELDQNRLALAEAPDLEININGCPNACGHHPIGAIGLYGSGRRSGERLAPHYNVLIGGKVEEGGTRLGQPLGHVPAKNIPKLLSEFLKTYLDDKESYAGFEDFSEKAGFERLQKLLTGYQVMPTYQNNPDFYKDWSSEEEFSLAGRGPGECGAGVWDMIEADLEEARHAHASFLENEDFGDLYRSVIHLAKSLLVTRGLDPKEDTEALDQFEENLIEPGWVDLSYKKLVEAARDFQANRDDSKFRETRDLAVGLAERLTVLYESMDGNLQFQVEREEKPTEMPPAETGQTKMMDLRGVPCPINYVRAKVTLEDMDVGDLLELLLDDGEPIGNVPPSLENDGQEIVEMRKENSHYYLRVRKKN